jgi:hypothetical protein
VGVEGLGAELDDAEVGGLGDDIVAPEVVNKWGDVKFEGSKIGGGQPSVGCLASVVITEGEMAVV